MQTGGIGMWTDGIGMQTGGIEMWTDGIGMQTGIGGGMQKM